MITQQQMFKYGFFALIIVIIVIILFHGQSSGDKKYVDELHSKIESLDKDISALDNQNEFLQGKVTILGDSIGALNKETEAIESQKKEAIKYYRKKLNTISKFTIQELDSSFVGRYGHASKDSGVVAIPKPTAIEITKDLTRLDQADSINVLLVSQLEVETRKVEIQSIIINDQLGIIGNMDEQLALLKEKSSIKDDEIKHWKKQFKKQRRQKFLIGGVGIALIVLSISN